MNIRKKINGVTYDTEKSEYIGCYATRGYYDYPKGEYCQDLYKTDEGDFFLVHIECAENYYDQKPVYTYDIIPLVPDEAEDWVMEHLDGEDYESLYGAVTEDNSVLHVCIAISTETDDAIREYAKGNNINIKDIYNLLLSEAFIQ